MNLTFMRIVTQKSITQRCKLKGFYKSIENIVDIGTRIVIEKKRRIFYDPLQYKIQTYPSNENTKLGII